MININEHKMASGQRFTVLNQTYYIDIIGPVTTICVDEHKNYSHVMTDDLRRYLKTLEHVEAL